MSSGVKQLLQIAPESTIGVTPSPFARTTLPFTDNSLNVNPTTTESNTILDTRLSQGTIITGYEYTGDINAEAEFGTFDNLIAAAAYNNWVADVLTFGGNIRKTFSILRGYTDISDYHIFKGCHISKFTLNISESDKVTFGFTVMGTDYEFSATVPLGTVTAATFKPKFSSASVGDILADGVTLQGVACVTALSFEWDNSLQTQKCLGNGGKPAKHIETVATGTGSMTVAYGTKASELLRRKLDNSATAIEFAIEDGDGNSYVLTLPEIEIRGDLPSGGNSDIINADLSYTVRNLAPTLTRIPA